jgi:hypothetical protein
MRTWSLASISLLLVIITGCSSPSVHRVTASAKPFSSPTTAPPAFSETPDEAASIHTFVVGYVAAWSRAGVHGDIAEMELFHQDGCLACDLLEAGIWTSRGSPIQGAPLITAFQSARQTPQFWSADITYDVPQGSGAPAHMLIRFYIERLREGWAIRDFVRVQSLDKS